MKRIAFACAIAAAAVSTGAQAGFYDDVTPNNSLAAATNIDPYFSTELNPDVGDASGANTSLTMPWVSIWGQGNGAFDYYSFTNYSNGGTIILDIDYTFQNFANRKGFDTMIALWKDTGGGSYQLIQVNDDYAPITAGDGGTVHPYDSFIQAENMSAGRYVVGVAQFYAEADNTGWKETTSGGYPSAVIGADRQYGLQVSVSPVPEPGEWALMLSGLGLMGFVARRRRG